ncbi:MAG: sodium:calcium antiporter [Candidatus Aenigmarchaeota archaeon]|nr:sodium:calcium antiporter [Candidatus Aenigmarchaeota archaeon]
MIIPLILFIAGLAVLIKASDYTVRNAISLSRQSGISEIIIGFLFVAMGTSVPELSIAIISSANGHGILSLGNLIGANIAILALIFGFMALFGFAIQKERLMEINQSIIFAGIIAIFLVYLGTADAAFGIFSIILFYAFCLNIMREEKAIEKRRKEKDKNRILITALYLAGSIALVIAGAELIVKSAVDIANTFGLAESVIGATILAIGTTIPELSVSIMALRRRDINLAIGDSIGSIVINIALILGIASIINPIAIDPAGRLALVSMLVISAIFLYFATHLKLKREQGIILIASYAIFLYLLLSGFGV